MIAAAMGWIGTLGTISAYVMLSRGYLDVSSTRYAILNCAGGLLAAGGSAVYGAWPSVGSNLVWSGIALHSILRTLRHRRASHGAALGQLPLRAEADQPAYLSAA